MVHAGNFVGNGQPQASALAHRAGNPIKALRHAPALGIRDTGAIVFHLQKNPGRVHGVAPHTAANGDHPASGRVLDGVVHQIGKQFTQQPAMTGDPHRLHIKPQVEPLARGGIQKGFEQGFAQILQIHALGRLGIQAARVGARQRQQLVRQLRGAPGGVAQFFDFIDS